MKYKHLKHIKILKFNYSKSNSTVKPIIISIIWHWGKLDDDKIEYKMCITKLSTA